MNLVLPVGAVTVFWDIVKCPVPDACDPRRVSPWIIQFLSNLGCTGRIAITAVGQLSKVPPNILEAVSSTGVTLYDVPYGHKDILSLMTLYYMNNPPPTTIMLVISPPHRITPYLSILKANTERNIVLPFPLDSTKAEAKRLWQKLLLTDPVRCSSTRVTPASWVCGVCDDLVGRGFENFMRHHSSPEHAQEIPLWFPSSLDEDNEAIEAIVDSPLEKNPTTKASEDNAKHKKKRGREEEEEEEL